LGTISAFAHGHRKTKKNLCRGGRSQDLPDPALPCSMLSSALKNNSINSSFATTVSQLTMCDYSGEILKILKCYNFLWVQRRHNCSPAASFANCVMTLYL